jgi:hypothetical protein
MSQNEDMIGNDPLIIKILKQEVEDKQKFSNGISYSNNNNDRYLLTIYETNKDYELSLNNTGVYNECVPGLVDFDDDGLQYLWEYAYIFFETNIIPEDYATKDLTYQEFANITRCKTVVKNQLAKYGSGNLSTLCGSKTKSLANVLPVTTYNPKYNTSIDMKTFVIVIDPPVDEIKKILTKPPCKVNFVFDNGIWIAKRRILKHLYKKKRLFI